MKELGIEIDVYCASEIDEQAMQVGIQRLSRMKSLGIDSSNPQPHTHTHTHTHPQEEVNMTLCNLKK